MQSIPDEVLKAREKWHYTGEDRPSFAITPNRNQESVWDYPRPPRIEDDSREIMVCLGDSIIGKTIHSKRVLETASPPVFYLPPEDINYQLLEKCPGSSHCEWKGTASYYDVVINSQRLKKIAWSYEEPYPEFAALRGYISFYPGCIECYIDQYRVEAQPGGFHGGWVTQEIVVPFKGEPGSDNW